jgi:universal stress protein E
LNAASLFAKALGGELWLANAYPDPAEYSWVSAVEVMPGVFYGAENIPAIHRQAAQELGERYGVGIDHIVLRPGDPRDVVTEATKELGAQLVVLGALKRGRFEQAVLGSTAEYVVAESQCDVLLVKPGWPAG